VAPGSSTTTVPATVVPDTVVPEVPTTSASTPGVLPQVPDGAGGTESGGESAPVPEAPAAPPVTEAPAAPPQTAPPERPPVDFVVVPATIFQPSIGSTDCGASELIRVIAPTATNVVVEWAWSSRRGSVVLTRSGTEWVGVVEVPDDVAGPLQLTARARDAAGVEGVSATENRQVAPCITPG
jgi:hypothetical protein